MKPFDYFKKTFIGTFVFIIVYKIVVELFEGLSGFTLEFAFKLLLTAFFTALTLGVLNYFFKFDISKKKNNT
jgi:uncharacterized membrane protein